MTTTERPHGRVKYVVEQCRCGVCRVDATAYERHRTRQAAYGRWQPYVDAEPARQHVRKLMAAGMGWRRVAQLAGVPTGGVSKLIYGDYVRRAAPSKRIRPETERRLLAVEYAPADGVVVDATGTHRRIQALVTLGWSMSKLADRLGMERANFGRVMQSKQIRAATARAIRELYDELWQTLPPREEHRDKIAYSRALKHAKRHGWVPPLAWDDDTIDDPAAQPDGHELDRRTGKLPPVEDLRWLREQGDSLDAIAHRFGVRRNTVEQALLREEVSAS